jgi:hypothetical protein
MSLSSLSRPLPLDAAVGREGILSAATTLTLPERSLALSKFVGGAK